MHVDETSKLGDMHTRWSPVTVRGFETLFRPWMARRLSGIYIAGLPHVVPRNRSVILAANHVSWWDGFLLREVHRRCGARAPLITLMKEEELRRFPFFRWMGVIGLGVAPAEIRTALRDLSALRRQQPIWLSIFPQGRMWPSWKRPLGFRPGLRLFVEQLAPAVILPVGLHLEPSKKPGPSAYVSVGQPLEVEHGLRDVSEVESRVAAALGAIYAVLSAHGEEAPMHWGSQPGSQSVLTRVRSHPAPESAC